MIIKIPKITSSEILFPTELQRSSKPAVALKESSNKKVLFDPCLLIGKKVMAICYVGNMIFWAQNKKDIVDLAIQLHVGRVDFEQKDDDAEFLGVHIMHKYTMGFLIGHRKSYQ